MSIVDNREHTDTGIVGIREDFLKWKFDVKGEHEHEAGESDRSQCQQIG